MRGITLTQPWATLVAIGAKRIETRSWMSDYRGPVAIHAAIGLGPVGGVRGLRELLRNPWFAHALGEWDRRMGTKYLADPSYEMPRGAIVAVAELVRCVPTIPTSDTISAQEYAFGDYSAGRYAWLLGDVRRLLMPVPYKGALSLWHAPEELQARLAEVDTIAAPIEEPWL